MQVDKTEVHILPNGENAPALRAHVAFGIMDHPDSHLRWLNFDCRVDLAEATTPQAQQLALIEEAKRQLLRMPEYRDHGEMVHFSGLKTSVESKSTGQSNSPLPVDA